MLKFLRRIFYVMGKALPGELSCPCDRSCFKFHFNEKYPFVLCKQGRFSSDATFCVCSEPALFVYVLFMGP